MWPPMLPLFPGMSRAALQYRTERLAADAEAMGGSLVRMHVESQVGAAEPERRRSPRIESRIGR